MNKIGFIFVLIPFYISCNSDNCISETNVIVKEEFKKEMKSTVKNPFKMDGYLKVYNEGQIKINGTLHEKMDTTFIFLPTDFYGEPTPKLHIENISGRNCTISYSYCFY